MAIKYECEINSTPQKIYDSLLNQEEVVKWWTTNCRCEPFEGGINKFDFKPNSIGGGYCIMKNSELYPHKEIVWECLIGIMGSDSYEWTGTTVKFFIIEKDDRVILRVVHEGLDENCSCFEPCSQGWEYYIGISLKNYLEKGKGDPYEG